MGKVEDRRCTPRVTEIEKIIEEITRTEAPLGEWYSNRGVCIDSSKQLQKALEKRGIVTACRMGYVHVYLRYTNGKKPIYIDPTYLQFIEDREGLPDILVGTAVMIKELFEKHLQAGIRLGIDNIDEFIESQYVQSTPWY